VFFSWTIVLWQFHISKALKTIFMTRDRPIYRPGRYISQYLDFTDISVSAPVGVDKTLLYSSRIQTTCARKHDKASQDSYLTARLAVAFQKQSDKINHGARVARHSRNKNIIGKFCNVWSYRMQDQVLCTNTLPLYFRKFSQREKFDRNLRCRSPIDAQFSTD